jgi:hypothetical protein
MLTAMRDAWRGSLGTPEEAEEEGDGRVEDWIGEHGVGGHGCGSVRIDFGH